MAKQVEMDHHKATDWKVGDLIVGGGDTFLILSLTGDYIDQTGDADNFMFEKLNDDNFYRRVLFSGLDYAFSSNEQAKQDFKAGVFSPFFAMLDQKQKELSEQSVQELLLQPTYRYLMQVNNQSHAVIDRWHSTGWKVIPYESLAQAIEDDATNSRSIASVTHVDEVSLHLTLEFLEQKIAIALPLNDLRFVALV
ncbi:hypothetical protein GCM10027347_60430 [Larkinella harenae]